MPSIEADTVLRGIGSNRDQQRINELVKDHQSVWRSLANEGASGPAFLEYGSAVAKLGGLNKLAASEVSAEGTALSPGERHDLLAQANTAGDLGVAAFRELESGDTLCRCGEPGAAEATPAEATGAETTPAETEAVTASADDCETGDSATADAKSKSTETATAAAPVKTEDKPTAAEPAATTQGSSAATGDAAECKTERNPEGTYKSGASLAEVEQSGKVLSQGDKGAGVTEAQTLLGQLKGTDGKAKYDLGRSGEKCDGIDGYLGPKTAAAVEQFKKDHGLKSDGKGTIDAETAAALRQAAGGGATGASGATTKKEAKATPTASKAAEKDSAKSAATTDETTSAKEGKATESTVGRQKELLQTISSIGAVNPRHSDYYKKKNAEGELARLNPNAPRILEIQRQLDELGTLNPRQAGYYRGQELKKELERLLSGPATPAPTPKTYLT